MDHHLRGLRLAQPIKMIRAQTMKYNVQYVQRRVQKLLPLLHIWYSIKYFINGTHSIPP